MVPLAGSPALAAGNASLLPSGVTTDQRGLPRVVDGEVDAGAVEVRRGPSISIESPSPQSIVDGSRISLGSFAAPVGQGPFSVIVQWDDGSPDMSFVQTVPGATPRGTASIPCVRRFVDQSCHHR